MPNVRQPPVDEQLYVNRSDEEVEEEEEEEKEILGSDDDEQEDPKDYCKGKEGARLFSFHELQIYVRKVGGRVGIE